MLRYVAFLLMLALSVNVARAGTVRSTEGNLYYFGDDGIPKQVTNFRTDGEPSLSPDEKTIVFVRLRSATVSGPDKKATTELWTIESSGRNPTLLLTARSSQKPENELSGFSSPVFSLDGGSIYFISSAWATSGAIHLINIKTKRTKFVSPGNSLQLVRSGKYVGHLIILKHKYFAGTGSYDFYWIVSPQGREVLPIGDQQYQIDQFLRLNE